MCAAARFRAARKIIKHWKGFKEELDAARCEDSSLTSLVGGYDSPTWKSTPLVDLLAKRITALMHSTTSLSDRPRRSWKIIKDYPFRTQSLGPRA